ncbi:MAG: competence/damage-inducible protein A [Planctomycetota bacterium]
MTLSAEIMSIGDELTSGQRLDTNSQYLSQRLSDLGIQVRYHTTIGDELADNVEAFSKAAQSGDVVFWTGGFCPTADDLTREAISEAFGLALELRPEALAHIESLFAMRKRPMPERNRVQAMFPETSRIIPNPHGTAPGIDVELTPNSPQTKRHCRIFALPGVPAEMMEMLDATVLPRLVEEMGAGASRWRYHSLKVFGIGESDVEQRLPNLIARNRIPRVGITVSRATITLRIAAQTATDEEFQQLIAPTVAEIRAALGDRVFGEGEIEIHEAVYALLESRSIRLGVIEVGACCRVAHLLASLQTSNLTGLVISQQVAGMSELGTDEQEMRDWVAGDLEKALSVAADRMLRTHDLDRCLAVGVYPTSNEVTSAALMPHADFAMCLAKRDSASKATTVSLGGHPDVLYHRLAKTALNFLRLDLLKS